MVGDSQDNIAGISNTTQRVIGISGTVGPKNEPMTCVPPFIDLPPQPSPPMIVDRVRIE